MRVKQIVDEDFVNYKNASMFIGTISCGGKCCTEADLPFTVCQNDEMRRAPVVDMDDEELIQRYLSNPITSAIVFGGLEPFEQIDEIISFITRLRNEHSCKDDIVIYTGYYPTEIEVKYGMSVLETFENIVVKWGRYRPDAEPVFDEVLGITLVSDNQFGERIS